MTTSFYNGISGLKSFQYGIDVWGDNIANINTVGYKENMPEFATLFANTLDTQPITSDVGMGSRLSSTAMNLSQGSLINTDNPFDLAIEGEGWFAVSKNNQTYYTRTGDFKPDAQGFLVDDNGDYLLVANANNLVKKDDGYYINPSVDTTDLVDKISQMTPISLPKDVILPAVATTKVDIQTNLNDSPTINSSTPANANSYFSALYDSEGNDMHVVDGNDFIYEAGEKTTYDKGVFSREICITDDKEDGEDVNIDFSVNNVPVKLTLPDGSSKEDILNALNDYLNQPDIKQALEDNNVTYSIQNDAITFNSTDSLKVLSNNSYITSSEAKKLVYKNSPQNDNEFATVSDLVSQIQGILNDVYPNAATVSLEKDGKISVYNNSDSIIKSDILKADNTNDSFFNNMQNMGNDIVSHTAAKSSDFLVNAQSLGGYIYDSAGNKDTLSLTFTKKEVLNGETLWQADIAIKDENGTTINTTSQDFLFNKDGKLISPQQITITSPQQITIDTSKITAYLKPDTASSYIFNQDGVSKGYLRNYQIDQNGNIQATFSNSETAILGQIPIYHFVNDQGLESIGSNLFRETSNSNKAFLYKDSSGKYIANSKIKSNALEASNVNMSEAMTELIVIQKAYSSAAKTVTTSDQMIQRAIDMKKG